MRREASWLIFAGMLMLGFAAGWIWWFAPANLFINCDGVIVERQLGCMSEADIAAIIERVP